MSIEESTIQIPALATMRPGRRASGRKWGCPGRFRRPNPTDAVDRLIRRPGASCAVDSEQVHAENRPAIAFRVQKGSTFKPLQDPSVDATRFAPSFEKNARGPIFRLEVFAFRLHKTSRNKA